MEWLGVVLVFGFAGWRFNRIVWICTGDQVFLLKLCLVFMTILDLFLRVGFELMCLCLSGLVCIRIGYVVRFLFSAVWFCLVFWFASRFGVVCFCLVCLCLIVCGF